MKSTEVKAKGETLKLVEAVKKEIESPYDIDLAILQKMQGAFDTAGKKGQREAFKNKINKSFSNKQLHRLNEAVVKNADVLMPDNDPDFMCRTPNNKIFQELLLLEAKNCGMKAKFNAKRELQPLAVKDIPREILEHYYILSQKFYPEKESSDPLDTRISKSINFLLYAPLFRESEVGKKLDPLEAATVEHKLQDSKGEYIQSLVKGKISKELASLTPDGNVHKTLNGKKIPSEGHKNNQKDERFFLIKEAIGKLEKNKKVVVGNSQREKIKKYLSESLNKLSDLEITLKKTELVDTFYQELYKNQTKFSKFVNKLGLSKLYRISGKSLEKIGKVINKDNHLQSILKPEVQEQLNKIIKELHKSDKLLPSEVKKSKTTAKTKPPIPKKPEHLKRRHVMTSK
ncbi:MAG: DUF5410 family protein [Rickettsia endosymbiont of Argas persicus]